MRVNNQLSLMQRRILSSNRTISNAEQDDRTFRGRSSAAVTVSGSLQKMQDEIKAKQDNSASNVSESNADMSAAANNKWDTARIRDVDMAKEMLEYTKQNILTQAHMSMMAITPGDNQGVLQLLR